MRSAVAVLGALLVFSIASILLIQISGRPPEHWPGASFAAFAIAYGGVFALIAGYVAARLAPRAPIAHSAGFAALLLAIATASYLIQAEGASPWSLIATAMVSVPAAILGGFALSKHQTLRRVG
jgi:drug/metabolite transporter (DMT)-like permease